MDKIKKKKEELQETVKKLKLKLKPEKSNKNVLAEETDPEKLRNEIQQRDKRIRALEVDSEGLRWINRRAIQQEHRIRELEMKYKSEARKWQAEKAELQRWIETPVEVLKKQVRTKDRQIEILQREIQAVGDRYLRCLSRPGIMLDKRRQAQMKIMEIAKPQLRIREIRSRKVLVLPTVYSEVLFPSVERNPGNSTVYVLQLVLDCMVPCGQGDTAELRVLRRWRGLWGQGEIPVTDMLLWIYTWALPELRWALFHFPTDYDRSLLSCIFQYVLDHMIGARGQAMATALCCCILVELYGHFNIGVNSIKHLLEYDVTKHSTLEAASILRLKMALRNNPTIRNSDKKLSPKNYYTGFSDPRFKKGIFEKTQLATMPLPEFLVAVVKQPMKGPGTHHEWFVSNDNYIMIAHQEQAYCFARKGDQRCYYYPSKPELHDQGVDEYFFMLEGADEMFSSPTSDDVWDFVAAFDSEYATRLESSYSE